MGSAALVLAVGWSAGIAAGALFGLPVSVLLVGAVACIAAAALAPATLLRLLALALVAFLLGQARVDVGRDADTLDPLEAYAGDVVLRGRVVEAPLPRGSRLEAVIEVDAVGGPDATDSTNAGPDAEADGAVNGDARRQATTPSTMLGEPRPRVLLRATYLRAGYGDQVEARGRLARPRSRPGWPLEEILARRQIRWVMDAGATRLTERGGTSLIGVLAAARAAFEGNTRAILPEPHASLVAGIVFGAGVGLPPDLRRMMSATGTSHLTAVSGANVAMVAGTLILVMGALVGRLPAGVCAIVGVWLYTLLVGAPPSALRAAAMATFALAAHGLGRQSDAVTGLALAVAMLLGWDPGLAFDLGFQLSATATGGLILLSPAIERRLAWFPSWLAANVAVAVAAQIATLPLILGTFQRLSLISLPANVLASPLIPPIMALGTLIALFGPIPLLGSVLGWCAWLATSALLAVVETAAGLPGGVVALGRSPAWLPIGWYGAILCWVAAGSADVKALGIRSSLLMLAGALIAGATAVAAVVGWPGAGRAAGIQVVLLDAEPAAAFVRTANGATALARTSATSRGIAASVGAQLELWESGVDVEIGPDGIRTAVDLLEMADGGAPKPDSTREGAEVPPGVRLDLADGVAVEVVDVRMAGQRAVVDLAILAGDLAILLPGPGAPSTRWSEVAPDAVTVAALPASAVTWARTLPPRTWLLLVGEAAQERARGDSGVTFLARREHGAVDVQVVDGAVTIRTERCAGGRGCVVDVAPVQSSLNRDDR